ncbi:MAG: M1 family aminopeptidase [Gemmatimonadota bacterium]|nr:M1 family aminopeptidase [Gemmatimonadota bacterium]
MRIAGAGLLPMLLIAASRAEGAQSLTSPGISRELATFRSAHLSNVRYALDLDVTQRSSARGHVRIDFVRQGGGDVVVDFRGPSSDSVVVNGAAVTPERTNGHLVLPSATLRDGENTVTMRMSAAIAPAGASIISFHDATDGADYLYTLLVPADANQLFPCFDQPDLKARVTLTLTTPPNWTALANGRVQHVDSMPSGKTFHFDESRPISTYLIAFAAGPWSVTTATIGGREISLYTRASRAREVESDTLLALNARAIAWMERYTAQPFPFQKFDFLLAPAFPFGGMEHPGAVFYNEESFIYRERPTLSQLLGREATIFHEVAHQWFGDFATMRWFDDLWLKEGFATYLAAVMQADLDPSANPWKTFYLRNKPAAYSVDASAGTTPVWQALANLDQAKSNYGAIVYNKAPGILKQLNYLVGDTAFRDGLRAYLASHAYGNATWEDLLGAVGRAARRPLDTWGANYIRRPGMPVLTPRLQVRNGRVTSLAIEQQPARALSGPAPWPIRTEVLLGYADGQAERIPVELRGRVTVVPVEGRRAPDFLFVNASDYAYALTRLDDGSVRWLENHIGDVHDDFLRAMLWGALWDQVRDARLAPTRFVRLALRELPEERDEQIAPVILGRLSRAISAYLSSAQQARVRADAERVLLTIANDTTRSYGIRKNHLDTWIGLARSPRALIQLDGMLDSTTIAGAPLRPPTRWAIVTALVARGAQTAQRRLDEETQRDSTSEGRRRAFVAGAAKPDSATKARYWTRYFADRQLNEDWVTASLRAFHDPEHESLTRAYLVPALDSLPWVQRNRRIFFLGTWVSATLDGQRSASALAAVDQVLKRPDALARDLREKVLQSRDELERTVAIRRAYP